MLLRLTFKHDTPGEYIWALTELTQELLSKEVHISKFHRHENEDINRWFDKLELNLESKGIHLDVPAARTQLINNLAGPSETFLFEIPPQSQLFRFLSIHPSTTE